MVGTVPKSNKTNKKSPTVGTVPNSSRKIVERGKTDTPNTHIHDRSLSWLGTFSSIKVAGISWLYGHKPPILVIKVVSICE